jgi:hypothetical protein
MERDFLRQVIALKKRLRQEEDQLNVEAAKIEEEILYAQAESKGEAEQRAIENESKQLLVKCKLLRAQLFGLRYAKGPMFQCIYCFVDHDVLPDMKEVPPHVLGARLAKCDRCGQELVIND